MSDTHYWDPHNDSYAFSSTWQAHCGYLAPYGEGIVRLDDGSEATCTACVLLKFDTESRGDEFVYWIDNHSEYQAEKQKLTKDEYLARDNKKERG